MKSRIRFGPAAAAARPGRGRHRDRRRHRERPRASAAPIEDLLGAYALRRARRRRAPARRGYLAANPRARAEVDRLPRCGGDAGGRAAERPPGVCGIASPAALEEAPPAPGPRLASVLRVDVEPSTGARRSRRRSALVALGAVARGGADRGGRDARRHRRGEPATERRSSRRTRTALDAPGAADADLVSPDQPFTVDAVVLADGTGFLAADDAAAACPTTETWQLWGVYGDDDVISLGVLGNRPALAAIHR